jgi:hypothetical protein
VKPPKPPRKPVPKPPKRKPEPKPVVKAPEPEPEPIVEAPEPEPVVEAPEPEPVAAAPEPEPIVEAPEPEPVAEPPEPVVEAPEPEPEPEPIVEAPEPEPIVEAPEPEPIVEAPEPEPIVEAPEPVAEAPAPVRPAADAPLAEAPEVPRAEETGTEPVDLTAPLTEAPEALNVPRESVPPRAAPIRRFARATPWPAQASELWTCEIGWKAGYRKSSFRAMAAPPGTDKREPVADSPAVGWTLMGDPEPPTPELAVRVRALMNALEEAGWEHIGRGPRWYEQRFLWRGTGQPAQLAVPELSGRGEPPEA